MEANRRNHAAYEQGLADINGISVLDYEASERNSHHYVVLEVGGTCAVGRDEIIGALHAENILARRYFWPGCHGMLPYRDLFPHADLLLTNTCALAEKVLILPGGMSLPDGAIASICKIIRVFASASH